MRTAPASRRELLLEFIAVLLLLLSAGYFRFTGLMWGEYTYPHPDERFFVWVVADIAPVEDAAAYFDTANSTLNPANRNHAFYVYGDFPVVLTRYAAEWAHEAVGWQEILQTGRAFSAFLDLLTVLLVYITARRVAGWKVGALAGLFSAAAVLQIQQAHFFTSDSFAVFFTMLTITLGVEIVQQPDDAPFGALLLRSILYGAAVGMAMSCKINTAPVAALLPAALVMRLVRSRADWREHALQLALYALAGGVMALLVFRVAMPYAFSGPGFLDVALDERWLSSIRELSAQSAGDVDFPPAIQWARRNHLFSLQNMVLWGLGIPLALMASVGFCLFAWRAARVLLAPRVPLASSVPLVDTVPMPDAAAPPAGWLRGLGEQVRRLNIRSLFEPPYGGLLLVWAWTGAYFLWQSMAWNPTMRYQLPIYPTLCVLAGWGAGCLWELFRGRRAWQVRAGVAAAMALLLTFAWAFAFTRIYTRPESRVAASRWILENVPGPINLEGSAPEADGETWRQILSVPGGVRVRPGQPYVVHFVAGQGAAPAVVQLPATRIINQAGSPLRLTARLFDSAAPERTLWIGQVDVPPAGSLDRLDVPLTGAEPLRGGGRYALEVAVEQPGEDGSLGEDPALVSMVQVDGAISIAMYASTQMIESDSGAVDQSGQFIRLADGGTLRQIRPADGAGLVDVTVLLANPATGEQQVATTQSGGNTGPGGGPLKLEPPLTLPAGQEMLLVVAPSVPGQSLDPARRLLLDAQDEPVTQWLPAPVQPATPLDPLMQVFTARESGLLTRVSLGYASQVAGGAARATLALFNARNPGVPVAVSSAEIAPSAQGDPRGGPVTFTFDRPPTLAKDESYTLTITPQAGAIAVHGSAPANETAWDMGLPFRMDGYDPYGGMYRNDLNFDMYADDSPDKYSRFVNILDQSDYIFFSSNRQWGTTTRIPERYPLTTLFYRELLGCPVERDLIWCYNVAEPGDFAGKLGFELAQTFTSYPNLGPLEFNTQFAEEAFTVYDHAKVMVFKKRADYDPVQARALLGQVDLRRVVHLTPRKAADYKDLLLTPEAAAKQQAGGAWAALFPPEGLLNRLPGLAAAALYLFLFVLGLAAYPLVRFALPGLPDRGYPLARTAGMVLFAYAAWIKGSAGVSVTRPLLALIFAGLAALGLGLAYYQREGLREEWRARRGDFARVELVALALFAAFLAVRWANPDLWHPIFGGEKPMDFSYFNAVLKSSVFPPYDPWFAGGYINYYYYGFVLVGMPVKLLGIDPTIAYNLILPALFMLTGLGAWSLGSNLLASEAEPSRGLPAAARRAALFAVLALLIFGNLGTVRMYWRGLQKLVTPEENILAAGPIQQIGWAAQGAGRLMRGEASELPYYPGDWYWKPSRAIQPESGNEITEFPMFTFLYADLHAHLMALPVTLLVLGWGLGMMQRGRAAESGRRARLFSFGAAIALGALAAGLLRPANTWDQYTYLSLAALALIYGQSQAASPGRKGLGWWLVNALLPAAALVGLAVLLYRPFDAWFAQGYNAVEPWQQAKTGLTSYLVHWGLFLYVLTAWLFVETVDWMAAAPLASLGRLRASGPALLAAGVVVLTGILALALSGVRVALIAGPLGVWVVVLLLRPGQSAPKRAALFLLGSALALTLAVELVAVKGDIGRMNTVFKFYYQAWTLFSISAAAALAWMLPRMGGWSPRLRGPWLAGLALLVFGAAMFPLTAGRAKIVDRMNPASPRTLDGMAYMNGTLYRDGPSEETYADMDLAEDYRAIRWMQANVSGSPVIVEANTPEYRHWGTRYTIYTGLPAVVGWNWHQRQQRTITPDTWVYSRIEDIRDFYTTTSPERAAEFLRRYNVRYIILGQLERLYYAGAGIEKFTAQEGSLWEKVYEEGQTVIYRVR